MSTLIGTESERWSLTRAIDALSESARQAGHPGIIWLAGLVYTLTVGLGPGWDSGLAHSFFRGSPRSIDADLLTALRRIPAGALLLFPMLTCSGLVFLPLFRMTAGLAKLGPARAWQEACAGRRTPPLRTVWRAGKGLAFGAFGLWVQIALMIAGAVLVGILPVTALAEAIGGPADDLRRTMLLGAILVPIVLILLAYSLVLSVLNQFALHSLAHNRRGVYSALLHGWRIMRNDGWATARATLVDVLLLVTVTILWSAVSGAGEVLGSAGKDIATIVQLVLTGFAGVARAGYWARAYRALGGLSADEGVPGL
jgi:hypothetical protein